MDPAASAPRAPGSNCCWCRGNETLYAESCGRGEERGAEQVHLGSNPGLLSDPIDATQAQTPKVCVTDAAVFANRLGAEVSACCVPGPWELVGTRPLRASEVVTHGDKKTPGNGLGEVRTPPGLGDSGSPISSLPCLSAASVSPSAQ